MSNLGLLKIENTYFIGGGAHESKLPLGVYFIRQNQKNEYYLERLMDCFNIPEKLYGDFSIVDRWIQSVENNLNKNLGIFLCGDKGSGKTITAQLFCNKIKRPVLILQNAFYDNEFINFIVDKAFENCIIFADEFEKIYDEDIEQSRPLLSVMDGVHDTKLIFLLTANSDRINFYLKDRPNRIKYYKQYNNLEDSVIAEIAQDILNNKEHIRSIFKVKEEFGIMSFDILINLIKDMNLFKEDAMECAAHFFLTKQPCLYNVYEIIGDKEFLCMNEVKIDINMHYQHINIERNTETVKFINEYINKTKPEKQVLSSYIEHLRVNDGDWQINGDRNTFLLKHPQYENVFRFKKIPTYYESLLV